VVAKQSAFSAFPSAQNKDENKKIKKSCKKNQNQNQRLT
jgi:hypothetical protein